MSVKMRQRVEREIASRLIKDAIAAGYSINVYNGGEMKENGSDMELPKPSVKAKEILGAMFATDDEKLYLFKPGKKDWFGWVYFIYGNGGYDVISDYTTNLEHIMGGANKVSDKYQ